MIVLDDLASLEGLIVRGVNCGLLRPQDVDRIPKELRSLLAGSSNYLGP